MKIGADKEKAVTDIGKINSEIDSTIQRQPDTMTSHSTYAPEPDMMVSHIKKIGTGEKKKKRLTGISKLMKHEGFRLDPYTDTEGYLTGGTGHKFTKEDYMNFNTNGTDEEKLNYWTERFDEDYSKSSTAAIRIMNRNGIEDNTGVQDVLINMIFNMGEDGVNGFPSFLKALANKDAEKAIYEMKTNSSGTGKSDWYKQVGRRVDELANDIKEYV